MDKSRRSTLHVGYERIMRGFGKVTYVCEKCGHADALCWRFPYSRGMETTYTTIDELKEYEPTIYQALFDAPLKEKNPIKEVVTDVYAYGLWKSGYVRRRWLQIWKYHGWKAMPMEKANHNGKKKNE